MTPQIVFVRVHEPNAVREILHEAFKIAGECQDDGGDFLRTWDKAVDLLAARTVVQQQPQSIPIDLKKIMGG